MVVANRPADLSKSLSGCWLAELHEGEQTLSNWLTS